MREEYLKGEKSLLFFDFSFNISKPMHNSLILVSIFQLVIKVTAYYVSWCFKITKLKISEQILHFKVSNYFLMKICMLISKIHNVQDFLIQTLVSLIPILSLWEQ